MEIGTVDQVWRYPVKSMRGEPLDAADLDATGVVGDRGWATRDGVRGGIRGAKKIAGLMGLGARYVEAPGPGRVPDVVVELPDGSTVSTADADVHERVSAALGHPVTLEALRPRDDLDHYRRGTPDSDDLERELRDIFGRTDDEPLPDLSGLPPELIEFESPPGSYHDAYPLLLLTDASLRTLAHLAPESRVDVRRFRPSILVAVGDAEPGFPEQGWVGRTVRVGDATLDVAAPCPRCVMVTRGFADLPADRDVLRTIVREADQNLGVYATVSVPGRVRTGDPVELVSA